MKTARQRDVANDGTAHSFVIGEVDRGVELFERGTPKQIPRCGRWTYVRACGIDGARTPDDFGNAANAKVDEGNSDWNPHTFVRDWMFLGANTNGWGRAASSAHGGGAHFGMADGSVQWVTKGVDLTLYHANITRAGGETQTIEF